MDESQDATRREFLRAAKRWSGAVTTLALTGGFMAATAPAPAAWVNGTWANRAAGGSAGWVNRYGGGGSAGAWVNGAGGWVNRAGGGSAGGWVNRAGGGSTAGWVNRYGGGGGAWVNR